jgi:hypothetical protein
MVFGVLPGVPYASPNAPISDHESDPIGAYSRQAGPRHKPRRKNGLRRRREYGGIFSKIRFGPIWSNRSLLPWLADCYNSLNLSYEVP